MLAVIYLILKQKTTKYLSRKILLLTSNELFYIYLCLEKEAEFFKRSINEEKILEKAFSTRNVAFLNKIIENSKLRDHSNIQLDFYSCFPVSNKMNLEDVVYLHKKKFILDEDLYRMIVKNNRLDYFKKFCVNKDIIGPIVDFIVDYKSFEIFEYFYQNFISKCETPHGLISFIWNNMFDFIILYYEDFSLAEYFPYYDLENEETIIFLKNNEFIVEEYYEKFIVPYNKVIGKIKEFN